jgi:hypothetical protein
MRRFQLELIYLYFPPSFHLTVIATKGLQDRNNLLSDGRTVENKGKLILMYIDASKSLDVYNAIHRINPMF